MSKNQFTKDENQRLYQKFCTSGQERMKLAIALEGILYQEELEEEQKEAYVSYLRRRHHSARQLAAEVGEGEFLWEEAPPGESLWGKVRWNLTRQYPYFSSAFSALKPMPLQEGLPGCDGSALFYPKAWELEMGKEDLPGLCRLYVHMVLHCLFGHILRTGHKNPKSWELACDCYVEAVMEEDFPKLFSLSLNEQLRQDVLGEDVEAKEKKKGEILRLLKKEVHPFLPENLYRYLEENPDMEKWKPFFSRDCHDFWKRNFYEEESKEWGMPAGACKEKKSRHRLSLADKWSWIRGRVQAEKGQETGRRGSMGGGQRFACSLEKKKKYDYRRFLERFMFPGEEMMLDLDSFDYIPYMYSRKHYEQLVFLEPLEYAEVHKLKELVIAIDTSGSCRGQIVRQFLEETYTILSRKENFFQRMRVYVIQCDSMIQDYACIESQEQWKEYVEKLTIQGLGGTDFRPVFQLVEKLREKKEIGKPGGLIYFTDGDGIYPPAAPDYETAFVFLNDRLKKGQVPSWGIELNLQLKVEEEGERS